jgi:imidazolonepropionase-like amidohydrolase
LKKTFIADIIAVKGDPTVHIEDLQQVVFVMKEGIIYKSPSKKTGY